MGKERLYGKKSLIERKAVLEERLYWKKGFIVRHAFCRKGQNSSGLNKSSGLSALSCYWNLVKIVKFGQNVKFDGNCEIW